MIMYRGLLLIALGGLVSAPSAFAGPEQTHEVRVVDPARTVLLCVPARPCDVTPDDFPAADFAASTTEPLVDYRDALLEPKALDRPTDNDPVLVTAGLGQAQTPFAAYLAHLPVAVALAPDKDDDAALPNVYTSPQNIVAAGLVSGLAGLAVVRYRMHLQNRKWRKSAAKRRWRRRRDRLERAGQESA
jgi:hypothetical protein